VYLVRRKNKKHNNKLLPCFSFMGQAWNYFTEILPYGNYLQMSPLIKGNKNLFHPPPSSIRSTSFFHPSKIKRKSLGEKDGFFVLFCF
jgi:hypothetical protein